MLPEYYRMEYYDSFEATVNNGVEAAPIGFTNINEAYYLTITNDDNAREISIRLNAHVNAPIVIKPRETFTLNGIVIRRLLIYNASGGAVSYRCFMMGNRTS